MRATSHVNLKCADLISLRMFGEEFSSSYEAPHYSYTIVQSPVTCKYYRQQPVLKRSQSIFFP
jgi:hypothetical protein